MFCRQQEAEMASLTRRIRLVDEDFEQTATRLQTAAEKLEEASKLAEETERYSVWTIRKWLIVFCRKFIDVSYVDRDCLCEATFQPLIFPEFRSFPNIPDIRFVLEIPQSKVLDLWWENFRYEWNVWNVLNDRKGQRLECGLTQANSIYSRNKG